MKLKELVTMHKELENLLPNFVPLTDESKIENILVYLESTLKQLYGPNFYYLDRSLVWMHFGTYSQVTRDQFLELEVEECSNVVYLDLYRIQPKKLVPQSSIKFWSKDDSSAKVKQERKANNSQILRELKLGPKV